MTKRLLDWLDSVCYFKLFMMCVMWNYKIEQRAVINFMDIVLCKSIKKLCLNFKEGKNTQNQCVVKTLINFYGYDSSFVLCFSCFNIIQHSLFLIPSDLR